VNFEPRVRWVKRGGRERIGRLNSAPTERCLSERGRESGLKLKFAVFRVVREGGKFSIRVGSAFNILRYVREEGRLSNRSE
jgi:hypothetical protein